MPKGLSRRELDIGKSVREEVAKKESRKFLFRQEIEQLVDRYNTDAIGNGGECVVIERQGEPGEVVAISYLEKTPAEAKEIFYLQRIFSTLFPHNFPHFYTSIGTNQEARKNNMASTIRQRIRGRPPINEFAFVDEPEFGFDPGGEVKYPFTDVLETKRALDLPGLLDPVGVNYTLGSDGGVYYLDTIKLIKVEALNTWNLPAITEYMDNAKTEEGKPAYTKIDRRIVEKGIRRLAALGLTKIVE